MNETAATYGSISVVVVGMVVLLLGVGLFHSRTVQLAGGVVGLLGVGLLTAYLARL